MIGVTVLKFIKNAIMDFSSQTVRTRFKLMYADDKTRTELEERINQKFEMKLKESSWDRYIDYESILDYITINILKNIDNWIYSTSEYKTKVIMNMVNRKTILGHQNPNERNMGTIKEFMNSMIEMVDKIRKETSSNNQKPMKNILIDNINLMFEEEEDFSDVLIPYDETSKVDVTSAQLGLTIPVQVDNQYNLLEKPIQNNRHINSQKYTDNNKLNEIYRNSEYRTPNYNYLEYNNEAYRDPQYRNLENSNEGYRNSEYSNLEYRNEVYRNPNYNNLEYNSIIHQKNNQGYINNLNGMNHDINIKKNVYYDNSSNREYQNEVYDLNQNGYNSKSSINIYENNGIANRNGNSEKLNPYIDTSKYEKIENRENLYNKYDSIENLKQESDKMYEQINQISRNSIKYKNFDTANRNINQAENIKRNYMDQAKTYNDMARVYSDQGQYGKALEYYESVIDIKNKEPKQENLDIATTYSNVASLLYVKGEYRKALEYYKKVLLIYENELGKEHPNTVTMYNNLAELHDKLGEYHKALLCYSNSLRIKNKIFGVDHPLTRTTYADMSRIYKEQGDSKKAVEYYERSLGSYTGITNSEDINNVMSNIPTQGKGIEQVADIKELRIQKPLDFIEDINQNNKNINIRKTKNTNMNDFENDMYGQDLRKNELSHMDNNQKYNSREISNLSNVLQGNNEIIMPGPKVKYNNSITDYKNVILVTMPTQQVDVRNNTMLNSNIENTSNSKYAQKQIKETGQEYYRPNDILPSHITENIQGNYQTSNILYNNIRKDVDEYCIVKDSIQNDIEEYYPTNDILQGNMLNNNIRQNNQPYNLSNNNLRKNVGEYYKLDEMNEMPYNRQEIMPRRMRESVYSNEFNNGYKQKNNPQYEYVMDRRKDDIRQNDGKYQDERYNNFNNNDVYIETDVLENINKRNYGNDFGINTSQFSNKPIPDNNDRIEDTYKDIYDPNILRKDQVEIDYTNENGNKAERARGRAKVSINESENKIEKSKSGTGIFSNEKIKLGETEDTGALEYAYKKTVGNDEKITSEIMEMIEYADDKSKTGGFKKIKDKIFSKPQGKKKIAK